MKPVVALGSGQGSTLDFFCQQIQSALDTKKDLPGFYIKAFITDNPNSGLLKLGQKYKIPVNIIAFESNKPSNFDQKLLELFLNIKPEMIVLAGFLKKIGPKVLKAFPKHIINSHPSLLPEFGGPGMYGLKVHQAVLTANKTQTGISIHLVNAHYDKGKILAQKTIPIPVNTTAQELEQRVKKEEKVFYYQSLQKILKQPL